MERLDQPTSPTAEPTLKERVAALLRRCADARLRNAELHRKVARVMAQADQIYARRLG
jgi:hypothetical protein